MDEGGLEKEPPSAETVIADATAGIVAGADTTSTALAGILYYLMLDPPIHKKLQEEVDAAFPTLEGNPFDPAKLASLPYLNAVMCVTQIDIFLHLSYGGGLF